MLCTNDNNFKVELTEAAFEQIRLIKSNDFTLDGHSFRLKIGGKGCDGFTYDTGFSQSDEEGCTDSKPGALEWISHDNINEEEHSC